MEMSGKTILITGSTDGVGHRVAERLAAMGALVLIHGRNAARAEDLVSRIHNAGGKAAFYLADFSSLNEVRTLADAVEHDHDRLDILINNAGIGTSGGGTGRQVSQDGHELRFAVNYLAGFLLTHRLLPLLKAGSPARILNVSSAGQQAIDFSDVMLARGYSGVRAYCQSKLAQIMFTFDLAEELAGSSITTNCLHPATYMDTTMVRLSGATPISTVDQGADAILNLATNDDLDGHTGLYFDGLRPARANAQAYDAAVRHKLRILSQSLTGLA
ncbi:SDR family NAD(P)-dependent oxidoreductase [Rhizobium rhizogenes]|uniref:SDR family NAD(P)-dependent oxidoreductase n=1 Tax=Rhizobium rhizogenes TaxID=359 RepID=UPI0022703A5E|nr:SDR family NAD(P)-dependent oxidoreductase [Rhizobium rhizogenes]